MNFYTSNSDYRTWAITLFSALFVFLGIIFSSTEWLIREFVDPVDANMRHGEFFLHAPCGNPVFGDSRATFGLTAPGELVNLAHWGESPILFAYKVHAYLARCNPRRAILQADPHEFSRDRETENVDAQFELYRAQPEFHILEERNYRNIISYWRTFIANHGTLRTAFKIRPDGSFARYTHFNDNSAQQRAEIAAASIGGRVPLTDEALRRSKSYAAFVSALEELRSRDVDVCLLGMPISPEMRAAEDKNKKFSEVRTVFSRLAEQYGAKYVNMRAWPAKSSMYADEDHLNDTGARAFTKVALHACGWR